MKAVVKERSGVGQVTFREREIPQIGPDEVLIKTKLSTIGAEVRVYKDDPAFRSVVHPPVILGTENCGEIVEIGSNIKHWEKGDRVVSEIYVGSCGHCVYCKTRNLGRCSEVETLGRGCDGAFAEYFKVGGEYLHKIPDNVSFLQAVMTEDISVSIQALVESHLIQLGDTVAILGPGPMGLLALQLVRSQGAHKVIISGISRDEARLKLAEELGADITVNSDKEDIVKRVMDETDGKGADVVVLAVGNEAAVANGFEMVSPLGRMVVIGISLGSIKIPWFQVVNKALTIKGSLGATWRSWEGALRAISSGRVKGEKLVTHTLPLAEWEKAFKIFESGEGIKVALSPEI